MYSTSGDPTRVQFAQNSHQAPNKRIQSKQVNSTNALGLDHTSTPPYARYRDLTS